VSHDLASLKKALASASSIAVKAKLYRRVEFLALAAYSPPNWLYTSGKPQRYNPAGVHCVYFSADPDVTREEFEEIWKGLKAADQPATDFCAQVDLKRVLDMTSETNLKLLKVDKKDLFRNWRRARHLTPTQLLGLAVSETGYFSAICYPSKAAADRGHAGVNFVIFKNCVQAPDSVRILGPKSKPLQQWP
jgi:RES domain-containing protein